MSRAVLRHVQWTLTPDVEPDADPPRFSMQCAVCGEESGDTGDRDAASSWALAHSGRHPSHRTYRETLTLPYRAFSDGCA